MTDVTLSQRIFWRVLHVVASGIVRPTLRVQATGHERLPQKEPYLILANHVTYLDPVWIGTFARRRVHFMASAHWFPSRVLGTFFRLSGAFPKRKFTRDLQALRHLIEYYKGGEIVSLFPEGERSWDGKTLPVLPGIGSLILRLRCPVVFVRITGGHQQHPRWARYMRWAPIHLEFSDPVRFSGDISAKEIEAIVNQRLNVEPDECPPPRMAYGFRLTHGLPNYLWACPSCFEIDGLTTHSRHGNRIECRACHSEWDLDINQALTPTDGQLPAMSVSRAYDKIVHHFGNPPVANRSRNLKDGVVLEGQRGTVIRAETGEILADGRPRLSPHALEVVDDRNRLSWTLPLSHIEATSIEGSNTLQIRIADELLQLNVGRESRVKWNHFIDSYRRSDVQLSQQVG